jgi:hypothetical protein
MGGIAQERIRCVTEKPRQPVLRLCMYVCTELCIHGPIIYRTGSLVQGIGFFFLFLEAVQRHPKKSQFQG